MVCSVCVPKVFILFSLYPSKLRQHSTRTGAVHFPLKTTTTNLFLWVRSIVKCLIHLARLPIFKIVFSRKWLISAIYSCFLFVLWFISSSLLFPLPPAPISHPHSPFPSSSSFPPSSSSYHLSPPNLCNWPVTKTHWPEIHSKLPDSASSCR